MTPFRIGRYPVAAYPLHGEIEIDIGADDGGVLGCGHPREITITRDDLHAMLAMLDPSPYAPKPADQEPTP